MKIFLLANNIVGKQICAFLVKQKGVKIVGLGIHEKDKQKYAEDIVRISHVSPRHIFLANTLRDNETLDRIRKLTPDLVISAFWGYILKPPFLAIPPLGTINFHPGYLPQNRGVNPNVWPFIEGSKGGVSIHYIDPGVDTGNIIARKEVPIEPIDTAETLYNKTIKEIVLLFTQEVWPQIQKGTVRSTPQSAYPEVVTTHVSKDIEKLSEIDLDKQYTGREIINLLRSRTYSDRYYLSYQDSGKRIFIRVQLSDPQHNTVPMTDMQEQWVHTVLHKLKYNIPCDISPVIPVQEAEGIRVFLQVVSKKGLSKETIQLMTRWRKRASTAFANRFHPTAMRTKKWFTNQVLKKKDRILYFLYDRSGKKIGHVGLGSFNFFEGSCEIDNVVRGIDTYPGVMSYSVLTLARFATTTLGMKIVRLRVLEDNSHAIRFYSRIGFEEIRKIPLQKKVKKDQILWTETKNQKKADRWYVLMEWRY